MSVIQKRRKSRSETAHDTHQTSVSGMGFAPLSNGRNADGHILKEFNKTLDRLNSMIDAMQSHIRKVERKLEKEKEYSASLECQLQEKQASHEQEIKVLKTNLKDTETQYSTSMTSLTTQIQQLNSQISAGQAQILERLKQQNKQLGSVASMASVMVTTLSNMSELQEQLKQVQAQNERLASELELVRGENVGLIEKLQFSNIDRENLRKRVGLQSESVLAQSCEGSDQEGMAKKSSMATIVNHHNSNPGALDEELDSERVHNLSIGSEALRAVEDGEDAPTGPVVHEPPSQLGAPHILKPTSICSPGETDSINPVDRDISPGQFHKGVYSLVDSGIEVSQHVSESLNVGCKGYAYDGAQSVSAMSDIEAVITSHVVVPDNCGQFQDEGLSDSVLLEPLVTSTPCSNKTKPSEVRFAESESSGATTTEQQENCSGLG